MITPQDVEKAIKDTASYSRRNLGIKFGPDFPQLAQSLLGSDAFTSMAVATAAINVFSLATVKDMMKSLDPSKDELPEEVTDVLSGPIKEVLAQMFYVGYKLGKKEGEVAALHKMAGSERGE